MMTLGQARSLVQRLNAAIFFAEAHGHDQIDLSESLAALDDEARAELQAAIDAAQPPGAGG